MKVDDFNPAHFHPTHKAKLWMAVTLVVILVGAAGVYYFVKKTYDIKQQPTTTQNITTLPAEPADKAKQVSEELKSVNLAELQAAVKDIKDILSAF